MLFKDTTSEKVVDLLLETLSSISWIESTPEDTFIFNQEKVWGDNILYTIMPHDSFLQALALVYMDSKILLHLDWKRRGSFG